MVCTIKWKKKKNRRIRVRQIQTIHIMVILLKKLSRLMSLPQNTWAIGSCVSAGFRVSQIDGGPFLMHISQMYEPILMQDSSVPMTLALIAVKLWHMDLFHDHILNGLLAFSSSAAFSKLRRVRCCISFQIGEKWVLWLAKQQHRVLFFAKHQRPGIWNANLLQNTCHHSKEPSAHVFHRKHKKAS